VILMSHLGRPSGGPEGRREISDGPRRGQLADLSQRFGRRIKSSARRRSRARSLKTGESFGLKLAFHPGEKRG